MCRCYAEYYFTSYSYRYNWILTGSGRNSMYRWCFFYFTPTKSSFGEVNNQYIQCTLQSLNRPILYLVHSLYKVWTDQFYISFTHYKVWTDQFYISFTHYKVWTDQLYISFTHYKVWTDQFLSLIVWKSTRHSDNSRPFLKITKLCLKSKIFD